MKTKEIILIVVVVGIVFGGLYFFKPKTQSENLEDSSQNAPVIQDSKTKVFEIVVKDKKITSGDSILKVNEGDSITILITSDISDELHIHGYDKSIDLEKGVKGEISFIANLTGRFEFELENSKIELGALEVLPK